MVKSEFKEWWRSQTSIHPSRLTPSVPICPCAACFNGIGHGQEVFRDPIDTGEVLPLRKSKNKTTTSITTAWPSTKKPKEDRPQIAQVKRPWYKQAGALSRKPSSASVASDLTPLCSTSTIQTIWRTSSETTTSAFSSMLSTHEI
ncbi:hypothetical protein GGR54DRAFT_635157 [Hypoxylon sp. NC1633]|nr:hypothetical protein GGR54DRAFT_635157 [Hypoxylon sp. NC1633]